MQQCYMYSYSGEAKREKEVWSFQIEEAKYQGI